MTRRREEGAYRRRGKQGGAWQRHCTSAKEGEGSGCFGARNGRRKGARGMALWRNDGTRSRRCDYLVARHSSAPPRSCASVHRRGSERPNMGEIAREGEMYNARLTCGVGTTCQRERARRAGAAAGAEIGQAGWAVSALASGRRRARAGPGKELGCEERGRGKEGKEAGQRWEFGLGREREGERFAILVWEKHNRI